VVSFTTIAALTGVAFVAGLVDAIAGGGGLLTVPALLAAGLPPHTVFATNKGSAVFGSAAALARFTRAKLIDWRMARWLFVLGFGGSLLGAAAVLAVKPTVLRPLVLVLLVVAAIVVVVVRPEARELHLSPRQTLSRAGGLALLFGGYDGFFGPGTGTFLIVGLVLLLGVTLPQATATAKVVNFASNVAACLVFISRGLVVWPISVPMAVGQFLGGTVGAHLAIAGGARFIRWVVLGVVVALVCKLGYDLATT
jgi:uncharacterized protein